jgi:hypothetical protein
MLYFNIPGPSDHLPLNLYFLNLYEQHRDFFYDDVAFSSCFGNFHYCIWDGGRNFIRYEHCTREYMEEVVNDYKDRNVALRLIFTNPVITEEHLDDRFGNLMLEVCDNGRNEVVVNSPLMEQYIRENYPGYKIISSTTKRLTNPTDFLAELDKDYYQVCLDYDLNKNKELLEAIPKEKRGKCEFLSNAICGSNCSFRKTHYAKTGIAQLTYLRDTYNVLGVCKIKENITHPSVLGKGNNLTRAEMQEYNKMGYKYFKLEGRTIPSSDLLGLYLYYFIKPECQAEVLSLIVSQDGIFINDKNSSRVGIVDTPKNYYSMD